MCEIRQVHYAAVHEGDRLQHQCHDQRRHHETDVSLWWFLTPFSSIRRCRMQLPKCVQLVEVGCHIGLSLSSHPRATRRRTYFRALLSECTFVVQAGDNDPKRNTERCFRHLGRQNDTRYYEMPKTAQEEYQTTVVKMAVYCMILEQF